MWPVHVFVDDVFADTTTTTTTKPSNGGGGGGGQSVQNGHHHPLPHHPHQPTGPGLHHRLANGGGGGPSSMPKMSPRVQSSSRAIWLFNDLHSALKALDDPGVVFHQIQPEAQEYFVKWLAEASAHGTTVRTVYIIISIIIIFVITHTCMIIIV